MDGGIRLHVPIGQIIFSRRPGVDIKPTTAQTFRLGFEVTSNRYDIRYYLKTLTYRAGAYYEQNYFTLNGSPITRQGITLGVSFPVFRYYNAVTLGGYRPEGFGCRQSQGEIFPFYSLV